jgi:hypothetical protein
MTSIVANPEACWALNHHDRDPADGEHYDTRDAALAAAADHIKYGDPIPAIVQLPHLCHTATLACGYRYDEDDSWVEHWTSAEALRTHLLKAGHRPGPDGTLCCPAGMGCIDCDATADVPDYAPPPGQLDLLAAAEGGDA